MFSYNPTVQNNAGEIAARNQMAGAQSLANAQMQAAEIEAEGRRRRQEQTAQLIGTALSTGVGFAVGGPVGAGLALAGGVAGMAGGSGGSSIGSAIETLASGYANNQAIKAKDNAYMGFFKRHGEDMGFKPEYLDELKNMNREDRVAAFDVMTGAAGQRVNSNNYLERQAELYGRGAATSPSGNQSSPFVY